jgi:anaerobic selenocysteine-containing dehydrogenase
MKRRDFLKLLGLSAVATVLVPLAPQAAPLAADPVWIPGSGLYRLDWPIGYAVFNQRTMLRLTSVVVV